jgi:hypothetical protein
VRAKYMPDHEALRPCVELGRKVGRMLKTSLGEGEDG